VTELPPFFFFFFFLPQKTRGVFLASQSEASESIPPMTYLLNMDDSFFPHSSPPLLKDDAIFSDGELSWSNAFPFFVRFFFFWMKTTLVVPEPLFPFNDYFSVSRGWFKAGREWVCGVPANRIFPLFLQGGLTAWCGTSQYLPGLPSPVRRHARLSFRKTPIWQLLCSDFITISQRTLPCQTISEICPFPAWVCANWHFFYPWITPFSLF